MIRCDQPAGAERSTTVPGAIGSVSVGVRLRVVPPPGDNGEGGGAGGAIGISPSHHTATPAVSSVAAPITTKPINIRALIKSSARSGVEDTACGKLGKV